MQPTATIAPTRAASVPLLDVTRGNALLRDEILNAIAQVYDSGCFINGPECREFERSVAKICDTRHAVGCASGSDALLLALMACNVGRGDEVIVPSFTFFATASAVWRLGATVVFADIDPVTFNICPSSLDSAVTEKTKAIIPVHLFGQCAEMDAIMEIASRNSLRVIEDAAQAIGATYCERTAGAIGDVGCISFYPTKNLGAMGDAGVVVTSDDELADRVRLLASHGMRPRYYHSEVGVNSRLDSFQAAALNVKMKCLEKWNFGRQHNAASYFAKFEAAGISDTIGLPQSAPHNQHVWNQFTIRVRNGERDELREHLKAVNIGSEIYYPVPLHKQECFAGEGCRSTDLTETELASQEVLSLPIFPELTDAEIQTVVDRTVEFFTSSSKHQAA